MTSLPHWVWTLSPATWVGLALSLAGLLILAGWWGKRRGIEPRCRHCGYELTGLQSATCPECGRNDVMNRPRIGVRRMRWGLFGAGVVLLLLVTAPFAWSMRSDWRTRASTAFLSLALDFGDARAADELTTRTAADALTEADVRALAARGLAVQRDAPLESARLKQWMRVLGKLDSAALLTDAEWNRMMDQVIRAIHVQIRPRARVGASIPARVQLDCAMPEGADISGDVVIHEFASTSAAADESKFSAGLADPNFDTSRLLQLWHDLPVGRRRVTVTFVGMYWIDELPWGFQLDYPMTAPSLRRRGYNGPDPELRLRASQEVEITVVPEESDDDCIMVRGDVVRTALHELLEFRLEPVYFRYVSSERLRECWEPALRLRWPAPWPLAFQVTLRQGERLSVGHDPRRLGGRAARMRTESQCRSALNPWTGLGRVGAGCGLRAECARPALCERTNRTGAAGVRTTVARKRAAVNNLRALSIGRTI